MKKWLFLLCFASFFNFTNAQANKKDVKTLLEVSGFTESYTSVIDQMAEQLPKEDKEAFKKDVQFYLDKLINSAVDKYAAAFSQAEVLKLIEFYKSPLAIKLVKETSKISNAISEEIEDNQSELQSIIMKYFM